MLRYEKFKQYAYLMRLDRPIGTLLLLWPTLWALFIASHGKPDPRILFVFVAGVILMRAAGCVINDLIDRRFDGSVKRTKHRPLVTGKVSVLEAVILFFTLILSAFLLVLQCNLLTIEFAVLGACFTALYPFLKRYTHLPQLGLGVAFSWGVPMAFAAISNEVTMEAWFLFFTASLWPVIYDTMYAMMDREDDLKIGVKSTAILFVNREVRILSYLQIAWLISLIMVGVTFHLHHMYYLCLLLVGFLLVYQLWLIKDRDVNGCSQAFLNNNWVGCFILLGIFFGLDHVI